MLFLPLALFEEKRGLKPLAALLVASRMAFATDCTFQFTSVIVWWVFEIAALAEGLVRLGANVRAVSKPTTRSAEFVLLLMEEATILRTSIIDVVRDAAALEDYNNRVRFAHASGM